MADSKSNELRKRPADLRRPSGAPGEWGHSGSSLPPAHPSPKNAKGSPRAGAVEPKVEGSLHVRHGRVHFTNEGFIANEEGDPFLPVFKVIDFIQEAALPLLFGVVLALILENADSSWYTYYFKGTNGCDSGHGSHHDDHYNATDDDHRRALAGGASDDPACQRWLLSDCALFGHSLTLHFVANDILMVFHFGLAMKEVTEALLPGGSLNPPSKAINPIMTTIGGSLGPIGVYFILLRLFIEAGMFDREQEAGLGYDELMKGWGAVTATDVLLAWPTGRMVFGDGHPAIDYLLLMAVASDAIGMMVIAVFYPDPNSHAAVEPVWLLLVIAGMACSFALRKWHYRKPRITHQNWLPYVVLGGTLSWIGFIKAHLHPSLALVPIVPFMPGPNRKVLEDLEEEVEHEFEDEAVDGHADEEIEKARHSLTKMPSFDGSADEDVHVPEIGDILEEHHDHGRGRALTIQAGLYSGLLGHGVDNALKVQEYDDDGRLILHTTTLDEFEQFMKFPVDFGLGFFALANAGVKLDGTLGAMAGLIILSLMIGKTLGVVIMYKLTKRFGYPAPFGVRGRHIRMIGLIASMSLTVSLFVADIAFEDESVKGDCKMGALLSAFVGVLCWILSHFDNFREEDVVEEAHKQVEEELSEAVRRFNQHHDRPCIVGLGTPLSRGRSWSNEQMNPANDTLPSDANGGIELGEVTTSGGSKDIVKGTVTAAVTI